MNVSINEIETVCYRVLYGQDTPSGIALSAAKSLAYLAAIGLPFMPTLINTLPYKKNKKPTFSFNAKPRR